MGGNHILKINNLCNLNCCFCADPLAERSRPDIDHDALVRDVEQNRQDHEDLIITGGEPTIYPRLLELLRHAKRRCGYKRITLTTNAVMLHSQKNVDAIMEAGVDSFQVSFSSSDERYFDAVVKKKGAFKLASEGIRNIKRSRGHVRVNTVLHKLNYKQIPETVRYLAGLGIDAMQLSFMNPVGSSIVDGKSAIALPFSEIMPYVREAFKIAEEDGFEGLYVENVPLCVAPDLGQRISDLKKPDENKDYYNANKTKPAKCGSCAFVGICDGVWRAHLDQFGEEEISPVSSTEAVRVQRKMVTEVASR